MTRCFALPILGCALLWGASNALAQESVLEKSYGDGVHAYNAGDVINAERALTEAIKAGTKDPRAYYFRALTYMRMGRTDEAQKDLKAGAEMEAADASGVYPVSRSLERVQGTQRVAVEKYRAQAKMIAYQRAEQARKERYEQQAALDTAAVKRQAEKSPARSGNLPSPKKGAGGAAGTNEADPFADPTATPSTKKSDPFASPDDGAGEAPAGKTPAPPKAGVKAGGNDPFGEPGDAKAPEKMPAEAGDPFGAPATPAATAPAAGDPFGAPATTPAAPPATAPAAGDPFGAPATTPAAPPATAPAAGDPFGAPATTPAAPPATAPAAGDPFGAPAATPAAPPAGPAKPAGILGGLGKAIFRGAVGDDAAAPAPGAAPATKPAGQMPAPAAPVPAPAASDDPFGAPAPVKAEVKPAAPATAPTVDDPFGTPAAPAAKPAEAKTPPVANPFGDDAAPAMKPAAKPAAKPATDDDPFGK